MTRIGSSHTSNPPVHTTYQDSRAKNPLDDLRTKLLERGGLGNPAVLNPAVRLAQHKIGPPTGVMTTGVMTPTGILTALHALPLPNLDSTQKPEKIKQYLLELGIKILSPLFSLNTHHGRPIYDAVIEVPRHLFQPQGRIALSPVRGGVQVGQPQAPKRDMSKSDFLELVFLGGNGRSRPEHAPVFTGQSGSVLVDVTYSPPRPVFMLTNMSVTDDFFWNRLERSRQKLPTWLSVVGGLLSRFAREKNVAIYVPLMLGRDETMYFIAHDRGTGTLRRFEPTTEGTFRVTEIK